MLFCLQKLENIVQQYILDNLYELEASKECELFAKTSYLFEKNVTIDLFKEYAHKRKTVPIDVYLNTIKATLLDPLMGIMPQDELDMLSTTIDTEVLTAHTLSGLDKEINVSHAFSPSKPFAPLANHNHETSRLRVKQQQRQTEKIQVSEQERLNEYLKQVEKINKSATNTRDETTFKRDEFFNKEFGIPSQINLMANSGCCWSLNDALGRESKKNPQNCRFADGLITTNNAAMVNVNQINLIGPIRKKPWPVLLVCDEDKNGDLTWKAILCSIEDSRHFQDYLTHNPKSIEGRTMWLVRPNGKLIAGTEIASKIEHNEPLALLLTQALFFSGDYETLSQSPWKQRLEAWLNPMENALRLDWIAYFEAQILMGNPPNYSCSPLYSYFHPEI